jgi:hypothetical protein
MQELFTDSGFDTGCRSYTALLEQWQDLLILPPSNKRNERRATDRTRTQTHTAHAQCTRAQAANQTTNQPTNQPTSQPTDQTNTQNARTRTHARTHARTHKHTHSNQASKNNRRESKKVMCCILHTPSSTPNLVPPRAGCPHRRGDAIGIAQRHAYLAAVLA